MAYIDMSNVPREVLTKKSTADGEVNSNPTPLIWAEWNGNYYQWGYQQIRIIEKGGCVWVVDEDLIRTAGMKLDKNLRRKLNVSYAGYAIIPGTSLHGFNEKAVLEFLNGKQNGNPEIIKLKLWFEREVFFTLRRKREIFG